ncbi:hypothetical protein GJAV_G00226080 [Gymnothorax javanicus]|nr:hypothetical protein GJAV_G00226080 [Gymnothorax javanicus]
MREHLMQQSMHTLPINQQRSRVVGDNFGTKPGREGTVAFGREIANSEGGVVDDTAVVPGSPMSGREEEHCSAREGERVRQVSGASSSSEKTGSHPLSHNHRNKIQPQTERSGQSLTLQMETEAVTHNSRALTSPTIPQPRKTEYEACASFPKTPPSSSPSSRPPSPQPSPKQPSSCPPASLVPTFSSPSPSVAPPFHPSHATKTAVDSQNSGGETENEGEGKSKKGEESDEWRHGRDTKVNSTEARDRDKYGWKEGMEMHSKPSKRTLEECEKQEMAQYLEDSCTNPNTLETHNASVGVIVSTRSENLQSGTTTEAQTASTCAASHSLHKSHNLRNFSEEGLAHSSAGDSHRLNGEDLDSLCTYSSNHESKMRHKRTREHSVSPPLPSSETEVTCGPSKVLHGTGTEFRNRGRGVMGTDVKYQGYHQPLPSYNVGQRKAAGIAAVDESSRRGSGVDSVRGQECNSELQQILPQPSLLQEVLQGYHLDRRYGRTESLKQKVSNACSESTAHQSHSRHHYITPESARPQVLVSELAIRRDHQSHTGAVTSGKHHPPNPGQGRDRVGGQDTSSHPLDSGGPGTKEEYCGVYKKPIGASPIHSSPSVEQSAQSTFPPPKHINLADYSLPHRRPASSLSTHSPAVQQILLQTPEPVPGIGVPKSLSRTHASSASSLSNMSSSERRSVICDVSPSHRITPERERDGETGHGRSHSLKGGSVASVIQQSHSTPSVMPTLEKSKVEQDKDTVVDFKAISKTTEEAQNLTSKSGHFQVEEASIQHPFHSPCPSVDTNSDTQQLSNRRKVESNSICSPSPQQASEHALSNPSPLCSTPSSCQPYFQGLDKASGHCTGLGRYGFGEMRVGTPKAIPYQQKYPSHPHHNVPLQAQPENSKSLKLHPHSLNQPNPLDEQCEWAASNNSRSAENMMSPRSVRPPHQSPQGRRSLDCLPSTQHHLQGNYYDPAKIWGLSERDSVGSVEGGSSQRNPLSAASGAVALPATAASGGRSAQSNAPREELVKSLHQGAASSSHNPSVCNNSSSSGSTYANLGVQQGHGQNRLGGSGDGNPLMMRRRVRSFISPIPAKRQHQDLSQHQRGPSNQYLSPQPNCESKQQTDASPSPDPFHAKMAIPNAPSPTHGKTKILPPRKGRGLKLEAIVQKITPNVKKSSTSNSHTESNHHSGLPNAQVSDCNPETQEEDSCVEANFLRVGSVTGSCLPYLGESLSLDEIMYYKGVEETGPLPPSAYPCDPSQDPQVPKRDAAGKMPRGNIRDMEPDFGIKASVPPITERDGVLERGKDELEIDSDFTLLGPLPPPPPLPRPVQASSPPSSSALSDIQNFTNTYQQLETRKGEHSAANLLRQKLQETGMGLGMDDYAGTDYFGTQPSHHNQNVGACMLNRASHMYQQHLIPSARTPSSMAGLSQLPESKPPENVVPKGYFPSGKKKGRPVGSVNKQKRVQAQSQNASIQTPAVTGTESLLQTPAPAPTLAVTAQIVSSSSSAAATSDTSLPTDDKISSVSISTAVPETVKTDVDSKDVQLETELKPGVPNERGDEDEEGEKVWVGSRTRRRRRRGLVGIVEKEDLPAQTQDQFSGYGSFPGYRKSVFAPYIHVERKEVELGAVCTIVNAEDEQMKGENGGDGETDVVLTAISQGTKVDREMEKARETKETEPVISALLESSTSGEVLPSSGYVLSGAVSTESHHFGQLLCCLCNKWANYKNLGDLYGPYYPPDYPSKLPKSQTRQSLLTSRAGSIGTVSTEATDLSIQPTEAQTANSVMPTLQTGCQDVDPVPVAAKYTVCPPGGKDLSALCDSINRVDTDGKELQHHDLSQETANSDGFLKHYEQSELKEKPQSQLQIQQWTAEEVHQRPQHRKLTSHPRFKRRHRSNEDLPKSTPTNSKASLPFQPPPQQFNPDTSEPYSQSDQLAQLPRVPLDPEELWVHEGCIVWASGVYLVNGRLHGLKEALDGARDARCSHCEDLGPTLGCYIKGCTLRYHYLCAVETDCSLNEDNFSLRCLKHKFPLNNSTLKPVYPELSERG